MDANMVGARVLSIEGAEVESKTVVIVTDRGTLTLEHDQDCCEQVAVEEVDGDPADLVGHVLTVASESSEGSPENHSRGEGDLMRWTFYRFCTSNGDLTIRWYGASNGWYSVDVDAKWTEVSDG
jgi:hypothetical protein